MSDTTIQVTLVQQHDYRFDIHFGGDVPVLTGDEPAPLGTGLGPSPVQLLSAAVGNCLSDSLVVCAAQVQAGARAHPLPGDGRRSAATPEGRMRVLTMKAVLTLGVPAASLEHLERVLGQFEAFCTVTQSVGQGIPITVEVLDSTGARLK
jgi:uncharacterized OsmC-like protein